MSEYSSWTQFDSVPTNSSWADVADSKAPDFKDDDAFPELGAAPITKTKQKALRNQQSNKEPVKQTDQEILANLPKGAARSEGEDHSEQDQHRGRRGDFDRQERHRGRRDDDQPPSKADQSTDWRAPRGDAGGFGKRGDDDRKAFGSYGRRPRTVRGIRAGDRDIPSAPPFVAVLSNINFDAGLDDVGNFLEEGGCQMEQINPDLDGERFKGSCEVIFSDPDSLRAAAKLDSKEFMGRSLIVNLPIPERNYDRRDRGDRGDRGDRFDRGERTERKPLSIAPRSIPLEPTPPAQQHPEPREKNVQQPKQASRSPPEKEEPRERKKLDLKPRSVDAEKKDSSRPSGIFGDAKPVDNTKIYTTDEKKSEPPKPEQPKQSAWGRPRASPPAGAGAPAQGEGEKKNYRQGGNQGQGNKRDQGQQGKPREASRSDNGRWERGGGNKQQQNQAKREKRKAKKPVIEDPEKPKSNQSQNAFDILGTQD